MGVKCKITMKDKIHPKEGTATGPERNRTGTCPECDTPGVALSIVGEYIRAHDIADTPIPANNPQPATLTTEPPISDHPHTRNKYGKALTEHRADMTDSGLRIGAPRDTDKQRGHTLDGTYQRGTVKIPVKGKNNRTKLVPAPATEDNVRAALAYWKARRPRTTEAHTRKTSMITEMYRRLDGMSPMATPRRTDQGYTTPLKPGITPQHMTVAPNSHQGSNVTIDTTAPLTARTTDKASANRGPALIPGRNETPRTRSPKLPWTEPTDLHPNGEVRKVTSLEHPRGHDRFDPAILAVPEPKPKPSKAWKRRQRRNRAQARHTLTTQN